MDYAALEDAIVTRLQPIADAGHEVRYMPSKQSQQSGLVGKARITVQAGVSKFDTANIRSTNDTTVQDEWLYIEVIIQSERLRGADGIYPVHKLARQLLLGWRPPNCELPLQAVDFEGVGPSELRDSVWTYSLRMRTRAMAMGTPDEVDETLITQITFLDSSSLGPLQPTAELYASDYNVDSSGDQVLLAWITGNADSVEIDNGIGEVVANGSMTVTITGTTTFTISATNGVNTVTDTVTVTLGSGCLNAIVSNQTGDWEEDIPSGDTWPLPYGKVKDKDGNDVQVDYRPASEGYIFEETACPAGGGSISVAVSDASPSVGDTITITATPSDFTPDSYIFFAHNDTTNELTFIAEQASNTFDWEVLGVVGDNTVYVLGVENGSPDITAFGTVNITVASSYLIDLPYGSNINASFSFVRRSAAYNDYVTLIRRSSDNAQEYFKLSANDVLDLTSENVAGTTTLGTWIGVDDGFLVTWKEQVSGITATNNIAASQAKIASAGSIITQNGVPAPTEVAWGAYTLSTPVLAESLFVIAKNDSISNAVQYPVGGNSSGIVFGGTVTEVTGISVIASGFYASHVEDVFIHLVSAIPSASLHIDGNLESAISLSPIVVRTIGTRPDNWGLAMDGKIMEVIFSSVAETVNRSDIESNINNSYTPSIF